MNNSPLCTVIIISFNYFEETTGPCLKSLARCPEKMEIIVVDNNSDEQTKQLLQQAALADSRIKLILLDKNRGYAAGNNVGAQAATTPLLLLLNSDTQVPPGAISRLCALLDENPSWDMLGPVTNSAGNDQHIYCQGDSPEAILKDGDNWCANAAPISFETDRLIFFCVMIRRELYTALDGLDEAFGLGYFEDTDFVYRARKEGKKLVITEEVFVYHRGRGSFSKVSGAVRALMKKNKKLFKRKHGHGDISDHWREKNVQALNRYQAYLHQDISIEKLLYAFSNRQALAETLLPNSPIKRFFYKRMLKRAITTFFQKTEKTPLHANQ